MTIFRRTGHALGAFVLVFGLASCSSLPRGAGLQKEVLEVNAARNGAVRDFSVAPVTRNLLDLYDKWPAVGEDGRAWIDRVDQPANRIIAPGDSITVTIWDTEDNGLLTSPGQRSVTLSDIRVSSAGAVFLPYIGNMRIAGMSPETARTRIEEKYIDAAPSTQVQLALTEGRQNTTSLVSGVAAPGVYPLPDSDFTVMGLIAQGGGVNNGLINPQIRLQRGSRVFATSVARLLNNPQLDTTLTGGDKVFVEADTRTFLSLGAAGTEAVHPFGKDRLSALEAMAITGGVADARADPQGILILRRYPASAVRPDGSGPAQERVVFTIDLTSADGLFSAGEFRIRPGDLVYATESPVTAAQTIFGLIGSSFGLARQVGTI